MSSAKLQNYFPRQTIGFWTASQAAHWHKHCCIKPVHDATRQCVMSMRRCRVLALNPVFLV
jgi:hypothetical protein